MSYLRHLVDILNNREPFQQQSCFLCALDVENVTHTPNQHQYDMWDNRFRMHYFIENIKIQLN